MIQKLVLVEDTVRKADETDERLSFWKIILLTFVTCGIYGLIAQFKLLNWRDKHFSRKATLFKDIVECIKEVANEKGKLSAINQELLQLERLRDDEIFKPRNAVLWFILGLLGIPGFYSLYYLTTDYPAHEVKEYEAARLISDMLTKLGIAKNPIEYEKVMIQRSFITYLLLSLITVGIFAIYWMYILEEEPNKHFDSEKRWEHQILAVLRSV